MVFRLAREAWPRVRDPRSATVGKRALLQRSSPLSHSGPDERRVLVQQHPRRRRNALTSSSEQQCLGRFLSDQASVERARYAND